MPLLPLFLKIIITGGTTLGLQLIVSRMMAPFFGVSLYVWTGILSVTLISLALGYKFGGIMAYKLSHERLRQYFLSVGAVSALWIFFTAFVYTGVFRFLLDAGLIAGSMLACVFMLFVPLLVLSSLNPVLVALINDAERDASKGDSGAGSVFFVSTMGSVGGVLVVAHAMLPHFSNFYSLLILAGLNCLLSFILALLVHFKYGSKSVKPAAMAAIAILAGSSVLFHSFGRFQKEGIPYLGAQKMTIVDQKPSYFGSVSVVDISNERGGNGRVLLNDGLVQNMFNAEGESSSIYTYVLSSWPLAVRPDARSALVLGLGAGVVPTTFSAKGMDVTAVEINPKMLEAARSFFNFDDQEVRVLLQDARTAVKDCDQSYDIVTVDLFTGDGVPDHLVTQEFFSDIKACLTEEGVVVINSFMHNQDKRSHEALVRTLSSVFGLVFMAARPVMQDGGEERTISVYFLTGKNMQPGTFVPDYTGMPQRIAKAVNATVLNGEWVVYEAHELADAHVYSDSWSKWKHYIVNAEYEYRKNLVENLPWQVLVN